MLNFNTLDIDELDEQEVLFREVVELQKDLYDRNQSTIDELVSQFLK